MWPFRPKRPSASTESYLRWLRAQRPPFDWFMDLSEIEQSHLATMGDEYLMFAGELAVDAADGSESGRELSASEETEALAMAARLADKITRGPRSPQDPPAVRRAPTFAGHGERAAAEDLRDAEARYRPAADILGRAPDRPADTDGAAPAADQPDQ